MLIASIILGIICFFPNTYYTGRKLGYSSWMQLKDIAPNFGMAFIIAVSVYFLKYMPISNWAILPIQIMVGDAVFFVVNELLKRQEYIEIKGMVSEYLKKK